ncbi:MAG: hypothetical protein LC808_00905 [Actinobacteria bacterium]|nr:hypothetical protein [Actinomycetota bacterium]
MGATTFLFTDIEGSTRLLQEAGSDYRDLLQTHHRLLRAAFAAHKGEEVGTQGDSFFVLFSTPSEAIAGSVAAQRALAAHEWPPGHRVRVRMGVHTGEATTVGGTYVGLDVHRAARIAAAAHGGQVLLSRPTVAGAGGRLPEGTRLRDLGEHRLKDLDQPERLYQLEIGGLPAEFPAPRALPSPGHLPARVASFIGRNRELEEIARLLDDDAVRLVTLTGPGGIGKTRLALEAASRLQGRFDDGVATVMLGALRDPSLVVLAIVQVLGVTETSGQDPLEALKEVVPGRRLLLVLDNFEHVIQAAPVVTDLLTTSDPLKVLVTSREVLRVSGEQEFYVPPLDLPVAGDVHDVGRSEAVRLFVERARSVRRDFALTDDNATAVAEIVRRLEGLPLAIELAAARLRLMPPDAILSKLDSRLGLLTGGQRDVPKRQRTLRDTIAWSYDLLVEDERLLFEQLAVFSGGCAVDAVQAVCGGEDVGPVLAGLSSLVDKSLLGSAGVAGGEVRFAMLETLREFALDRLEGRGAVTQVRQRHAEFFLRLAERAEARLRTGDQDGWFQRLGAESDNLRVAIRWFLDHCDPAPVVRIGWSIWPFWWEEGRNLEGSGWMEEALRAGDVLSVDDRASATAVLGILAFSWGDYQRGVPTLRQAEKLCRQSGNAFGLGMSLTLTAVLAAANANTTMAEQAAHRALEAFHDAGDAWGVAFAQGALARILLSGGHSEEALELLEPTIADIRRLGDKHLLALGLMNLGWARLGTGKVADAVTALKEALQLTARLGNQVDTARVLEAMAAAAVARRDAERGALLYGAAEAVRRAIGARVWLNDRASSERVEAALRVALPGLLFDERFSDGLNLSVSEALEIVEQL